MNVQQLIEALQKLPPQAGQNEVRVKAEGGYAETIIDVSWQGNHTLLEGQE